MTRVRLKSGLLKNYLQKVKDKSDLNWSEIARLCLVSPRTLSDWKREKHTPNFQILAGLSKKFDIPLPKGQILSDYWYVKKGAILGGKRRFELYGPPGSIESRKKGGVISQIRRRENPEKYRRLGCVVRKNFKKLTYSNELAELVGILMGDGGMTEFQTRITLSQKVDREYAKFVSILIKKVIGEKPYWMERDDSTIELIISGVGLGDSLELIGLQRGNKVANQIKFPKWIWKKRSYQIACARGLFDTDGGMYFHHHNSGGHRYRHFGASFTNRSMPLVEGFYEVMQNLEINAKRSGKERVYIYSLNEVVKYMKLIGSSNPKNHRKLKYHLSKLNRI